MASKDGRHSGSPFGSSGRELLVFIFFLVLSAIFWLLTALNDTYEKEIAVRVQLSGVPNNVIITNDINDTLRVTVKDKGLAFVKYIYSSDIPTVVFSYDSHAKGNGRGTITSSEIQKQLSAVLLSSTKVVTVKPERVDFSYDKGISKKVPVRIAGKVTPAGDYYLAMEQIVPQTVTVYALKSVLDTMKYVYTEDIHVKEFVDSVSVEANLRSPKGVKVTPSKVKVTLYADVMTEQSIEVPITCVGVPDSLIVRTFPQRAEVRFNVGASLYHSIQPTQFCVELNYNELGEDHEKCSVHLTKVPSNASNARLATSEVDYVVEGR